MGYTQESLGRKCNPKVTQNTIFKIESRQTESPICLPQLASALQVSVEELMGDSMAKVEMPSVSVMQRYKNIFSLYLKILKN